MVLEALEPRRLLTIVFDAHYGAETVHDNGSDVLSDVPVYLIFWGPTWNQPGGPASAPVVAAAETIMNSIYLSGVSQYRPNIGIANLGGVAFDTSSPNNGFSEADIGNVVANAIGAGNVPDPYEMTPKPLFLVVTPPGILSDSPTAGSYHDVRVVFHGNPADPIELRCEGWIQDNGNIDATSTFISHELVEAVTNPYSAYPKTPLAAYSSITTDHGASWPFGGDHELADAEAQLYTYRIKGVQVQSYWSAYNNAYIVPDGTVHQFEVDPTVNAQGQITGGTLIIRGDQFQVNTYDQILIEATAAGGIEAKLNGETVQFDPGQITSVVVEAGGGVNQIYVPTVTTGVSVTVKTSTGTDLVWVGSNGNARGIQGAIKLVSTNGRGQSYLTINDSSDTKGRSISVDDHSVTGLTPAPITFDPTDLGGLVVESGKGNDTVTVKDTADNALHPTTTINTGQGLDSVQVRATHGALVVDAGASTAQVTIGFPFPEFGFSVTSGIHGPVKVQASLNGSVSLTIDDHGNDISRWATLGNNTLTGFAPAPISWTPTATGRGGVSSVQILGGNAGNTFTVMDTSLMEYPTQLITGGGNDSVNVWGTTGALVVNEGAGQNFASLGKAGNVDAIKGQVKIGGAGSVQVLINDALNPVAKTITLFTSPLLFMGVPVGRTTTVTGLAPANILLDSDLTGTNGVNALSVFGGEGGNTFTANGVGPFQYPVELSTGSGNDWVYVPATISPLNIDAVAGNDTVVLGRDAQQVSGNVAKLLGDVTVTNTSGKTALILDDGADMSFRAPILYSGAVTALAPAQVRYTPGQVDSVLIQGSAAADIYNVISTPWGTSLTINGGVANDTLNLGNNTDGLDEILGPVTFNGGSGANTLNVNDAATAQSHYATLTNSSYVVSHLPATTFSGLHQMNVALGKATEDVTLALPLPTFAVSIKGGTGTDTLTGANVSNSWIIDGPNAGTLGNVSFKAIANLCGGTGRDVFKRLPGGSLTGSLTGGGAPVGINDWLDESAFSTPLAVNLTTGVASGIVGGVDQIEGVLGGNGNDVLVGGSAPCVLVGGVGSDHLTAGTGRAILIGGGGGDILNGGPDDDILIGNKTAYDANTAALDAILSEWSQVGATYANRIATIRAGVGPNKQYRLDATTVIDDQAVDVLTGNGGNDWFWATTSGPFKDKLTDRTASEVVN
jgi:hypothetical protein